MLLQPFPDESSTTITEVESVDLNPGQRAVITFTPSRTSTRYRLGAVAISKRTTSSYEVQLDGNSHFGPEEIPPTDIDDMGVVWTPALPMEDEMRVIVEDLRASGGTRTYHAQPLGYEEPI